MCGVCMCGVCMCMCGVCVCVCVCFVQYVTRKRRTILSTVACSTLQYFTKLSQKRHGFREEKNIEHKMCVLIFSTTLV